MVSRRRKIFNAMIVVAVGLALAWPFRHTGEEPKRSAVATAGPAAAEPEHAMGSQPQGLPMQRLVGPVPLAPQPTTRHAARDLSPVVSTRVPRLPQRTLAFQAGTSTTAPHMPPALPPLQRSAASSLTPTPALAVAPSESKPDRLVPSAILPELPPRRVHVVHNGDTLEKLAKRYLGDEGRMLELFDLNRETLLNPHLLPIGAELVLPIPANDEQID